MITQSFKNGDIEIRTEHAISPEDAKNNGFSEGSYSRFFINNKPVQNYMAMVRHIIDETQKTGKRFIPPSQSEIIKLRTDVINKQKEDMRSQLSKLQAEYKKNGAPDFILKQLDEAMDKIDIAGMRVVK